jgi:hypothetical protein
MAAMARRVGRSPGLLMVTLGLLVAASCSSGKLGLIRSSDASDGAIDRVVGRSDGARDGTMGDRTAVDGTTVDRTTVDRMVGDRTVVDAAVEARPDAVATCAGLPLGAPAPVGACPDAGVASCGFDGTCDGAGGCHRYAAGIVCAAPTCLDSATFQPVSLCDGQGSCVASLPLTCSPYSCVNGACDVDDCKFIPADCIVTTARDASPG